MTSQLPEHHYRQALQSLQKGQWAAAREHLLQAAGRGYPPAIKELGILELHGIGGTMDAISAVNRFQQSTQEPESCFELSRCLYFGFGIQCDRDAALHWLQQAALSRFPEALRVLAMLAQWHGRFDKCLATRDSAEQLMWVAAVNGDAFARYLCEQGSVRKPEKTPNNETITEAIDSIAWPRHQPKHGTALHKKPDISLFDCALTDWQCEYIRFRGAPHLRPSMVLDPATGQRIKDPLRNSDSAGFDWFLEDVIIHQIMQSVTALVRIDANRSEPLHLLRYGIGQQYKPHYDFVGGLEYTGRFPDQQRTDTFCLYLNDVPAGGQTAFPRLQLQVPAKKGQVLHFQNVDEKGRPYVDSLHCGLAVTAGEKWLATLWIRQNDTQRGRHYE